MGSDIAAYDYCAFILLCIIVVYYFRTSVHGTNRVRIMAMIVVLTMAASVFDATRVRFASIREVSDIRFFAVNFGYLLLISSIPFMYLLYIVATTDTWHKLTKFKIEIVLCTIPMAVNVAILALNWTYPIAFEIGPDRTLTRHWGYYMIFFIFMLYGLIALAFLKKRVQRRPQKILRAFGTDYHGHGGTCDRCFGQRTSRCLLFCRCMCPGACSDKPES